MRLERVDRQRAVARRSRRRARARPPAPPPGSVSRLTIPISCRALGADRVAGEGELHRQVVRDPARQPQQRAGGGDQPALDLGDAEARVARGHDQVARERDLEPAGQRVALDRGDQRLARRRARRCRRSRGPRRTAARRPRTPSGPCPAQNVPPGAGEDRRRAARRRRRAGPAPPRCPRPPPALTALRASGRLSVIDQDARSRGLGQDGIGAHAPNRVSAGSRSPRSSARSTSTQRSPRASASTRACGLTICAASTPRQSAIAGSSRIRSR